MRIVYVITLSEIGGAQKHLLYLIQEFSKTDEVFLITGSDGFLTRKAEEFGVRVILIPELIRTINPLRDFQALNKLKRILNYLKPDIVHSHSSKAGVLTRLAGRSLNLKVIHTVHGWPFTDGVPFHRFLYSLLIERLTIPLADRVVVVCKHDLELGLRYKLISENRIKLIYNGIPDLEVGVTTNSGPPVRIIMVGRFAEPKEQDALILALKDIRLPWELVLVGDGPRLRKVKELVNSLNLESRVSFTGAVEDVDSWLKTCHIFVLMSRWEGFPISILEAMRIGLPVIASDVGGINEQIIDGETGYLVPRDNIPLLRDRLIRLIQNPQLRNRMGLAGKKRFQNFFTVEKMLKLHRELYSELLT